MPRVKSPRRARSPRSPRGGMVAYCVKCRRKQTMVNPVHKVAKNGTPMVQGRCPKCDTTMTRFVKA